MTVSRPLDGTCLDDPSIDNIAQETTERLHLLSEHYAACVDDFSDSRDGMEKIFLELYSRDKKSAAYQLAYHYKYAAPDQEKSLGYANEAIRLGDPRGESIVREWSISN